MLAPSADAVPAAPVADSVFMLDSHSNGTSNDEADSNNKRKRSEEAVESSSVQAKVEDDQTPANGSAQVDGQGKKKRRRRGRGGANKNEEETGMESVDETDAHPPAEEKSTGKKSTGPIEENEVELARYTHTGAQGSDPFSFEELDPEKCKALSSSLWELKVTLQPPLPLCSSRVPC
jgi:hypothetical protein